MKIIFLILKHEKKFFKMPRHFLQISWNLDFILFFFLKKKNVYEQAIHAGGSKT